MRYRIYRFNQQCHSIADYIISVLHDLNGTECQTLRKFQCTTIIYRSSFQHFQTAPLQRSQHFRPIVTVSECKCMCIAMYLRGINCKKELIIRKEIKSINLNLANYVDQSLANFTFNRNRFLLKRNGNDVDNPRKVLIVCTQNQRMVSVKESQTIDFNFVCLNNNVSLNNKRETCILHKIVIIIIVTSVQKGSRNVTINN